MAICLSSQRLACLAGRIFFLHGPAARNHNTRPLILRTLHKVCKGLVRIILGWILHYAPIPLI